jgi:hypothetical protein
VVDPSGYPRGVTPSPTATRRALPDQVCADAVDVAREALLGSATADLIGQHVGFEADDERVVTHRFECLGPAYRGWTWAVTVTRASRSRVVTVDEIVLLPGPGALLAPEWLPWSQRLRPGDLGVGDLLPTREDDARLEPGWNAADFETPADDADQADDAEADWAETVVELGLARPRVLSPIGLADALDRWYSGDAGPEAALAQAAPASCASCGFLLPLGGRVSQAFGVCANGYSPSDGHVVSLEHGCGAHSEAAVVPSAHVPPPPVLDNLGYDPFVVEREIAEPATEA